MTVVTTRRTIGHQQIDCFTYRNGQPYGHQTYFNSTSTASGFVKPDEPVINKPDSTGYRSPSDYQIRPNASASVEVELGGTYEERSGVYHYVNHNAGTAAGVFVGATVPTLNPNHVRTKVLNNALQEVLDVSMVLAELSGTVSTLTDNLGRVGRSLQAFRKGRPKEFYYLLTGRTRDNRRPTDKFLRETASSFLEWKYGIMPTIYDIRGACEGLDLNASGKFFDNPPLLVARARDRDVYTNDAGIVRFRHYGGSQPQIRVSTSVERHVNARLDYTVTAEGLRGLSRYGIGMSSVATVGWELIPFSFVIDMAIPIGSIIKAWSALEGCTVKGYCETQWYQQTVSAPETRYDGGAFLNGSGTAKLKETKLQGFFTRKAYPSPPMPVPYVKNPVKIGNLQTVLALFTTLRRPDAK